GGIILTGGGAQLKHLTQLTEFKTGIHARIGYPNEHLASDYIEELAMPMYSTCIGLILKGYNDYENKVEQEEKDVRLKRKRERREERQFSAEDNIEESIEENSWEQEEELKLEEEENGVNTKPRKNLKDFMDSMKKGLIDLFREERSEERRVGKEG